MLRIAALLAILIPLSVPCVASASEDLLFMANVKSAALTSFWHDDAYVHAEVLLPNSYSSSPNRYYPTIYVVRGFYQGDFRISDGEDRRWRKEMSDAGQEFIIVFLDGQFTTGYHAFANSVNNGPWGDALVNDFIPEIERHFRMVPHGTSRFITGHSSGGWSSLWLQVNYPEAFGGVWSIAPDPVDFHDFTGPDLTRDPPQNFYRDDRGNEYGIGKVDGSDVSTLHKWVIAQDELFGNQFESLDSVFSPKGPDGKPEQLFDHRTGAINGDVARYWEEHYDIARILRERWSSIGCNLAGKLHIFVGTDDTFHLNGPVRLLQMELQQLGSDAEIVFVPHANHFDILRWNGDILGHDMIEMKDKLRADASTIATRNCM